MKIKSLFFAAALFFMPCAFAQEMDAAAILKQVDAIRAPSENFVFTAKVHSQTANVDYEGELQVSVRDTTKSLSLFRKPVKENGRALLMDGPNMWIYIPGTSRPLRISPQQQLTGAVSNADVARTVFRLDYEAGHVEKQPLDGLPALKLDLRARESNVLYPKIELWIAENDLHPLKADFFSLSGKLIRTVQYGGYQDILGRQRPTELRITDAINPAVKATLVYSDFKIKETPLEYYQPSYLGRLGNGN